MSRRPPLDRTLVRAEHLDGHVGEKCSHNQGCWVVVSDEGECFTFSPATQMQKDSWLAAGDEKARAAMLRWLCFECNTVQTP